MWPRDTTGETVLLVALATGETVVIVVQATGAAFLLVAEAAGDALEPLGRQVGGIGSAISLERLLTAPGWVRRLWIDRVG